MMKLSDDTINTIFANTDGLFYPLGVSHRPFFAEMNGKEMIAATNILRRDRKLPLSIEMCNQKGYFQDLITLSYLLNSTRSSH